MQPTNDYFKIEVGDSVDNPNGWVGNVDPEEGVREGRVVAISDEMAFFGFNTYMFDKSLMDTDLLKKIYKHYKSFVGKKVSWPQHSETGSVIEEGGKRYAYVKMSAIMAKEVN